MRLFVFAAMLAAGSLSVAHADPVTYTLTGSFTGSLGAVSFHSLSGTITFAGDTSGITDLGAGFFTNTAVQGLGTATFLSATFGAESQFDGAGFYDIANGFGSGIFDPALGNYDLTSPFADTAFLETSFPAEVLGATEATTLGDLSLTGDDNSSATFTASVATAVVPEPGGLTLLETGLLSIAGMLAGKRRRRS
jgi:hypothetical protein